MIHFNVPPFYGTEMDAVSDAVRNRKICGDGPFTKQCNQWIESKTGTAKALLTTSCTHALEMAAILADIQPGDEIIMPSYTFVSTANAFVLRGAQIVFVDIRPDTMNMDEQKIEAAITDKTKAIVPMHYAGVGCEMDVILELARHYRLSVIEDAAQGIMASYKDRSLGAIGDFGAFSFHETKNYSMGEGGALLIQNATFVERAEIIREKGTNRSQFWRGEIDKYRWVDFGSSYLPSELNAAYLSVQLEQATAINSDRLRSWQCYAEELEPLAQQEKIELPFIPPYCTHNAHMFYIKLRDAQERSQMIAFLKEQGVESVFHYVPLHSSPAGRRFSRFHGEDIYTTCESERILRLPLYYRLSENDLQCVVDGIQKFLEL